MKVVEVKQTQYLAEELPEELLCTHGIALCVFTVQANISRRRRHRG